MKNKILSLLGFAAKAGKLSFGTHATEWSVSSGKARLVCVADNISEKSLKEISFKAKGKAPVKVLDQIDIDTLSKQIGKKCGIIAINDEGFAKALIEYIN